MDRCTHSRVVLSALIVITLLALYSGCATNSPNNSTNSGKQSGGASDASSTSAPTMENLGAGGQMIVPYYSPPDRIDFCGEPVPLNDQEVLERFDREFTVIVYNHAQVYLWLKRMERYFHWIEERLRSNDLPEDLKYVAIAESDLLPNACSPKGAAGPWQFMPSTGSSYGLNQKGSCDERYDFELATECAFRFMSDLYRRYKNWTLAIATYNCGDKRIVEQTRLQGTNNYYQLKLPNETERYIFRIIAIKAVLSNPARYGYNLPKGQGYPEFRVDRVNVSLSCPVPFRTAAESVGTTYRELKRLNPAFRGEEIPAGTHQVKVPAGTGKDLERGLASGKADLAVHRSEASEESRAKSPEEFQETRSVEKANKSRSGQAAKAKKSQASKQVSSSKPVKATKMKNSIQKAEKKAVVKTGPPASDTSKKGNKTQKTVKNKQ